MPARGSQPDGTMSFLEHLDELRARLLRCIVAYLVVFSACWYWSGPLLKFLVRPMQEHLRGGAGDIVFINVTEPFFIYMKASALVAIFIASPFILYQIWAFVSPGLYRHERMMVLPFLFFGTLFFLAGGAFGYYVALPRAAGWLIALGADFHAALTLRSAFQFVSLTLLGLGAVFELPVLIFFLARMGVVTPGFLMRHFRVALIGMAIVAAVITPTGDMLTMSMFAVPMILLYLLGVLVAWLFGQKR